MEKRINAKKVFLTYNKILLSKEQVLEKLQQKFPIKEYIISKEFSKNNKENHIHVFLSFAKKINCDINQFNILDEIENKIIKGNYQSVRNTELCIQYIKKNNDYITNVEDEYEIFKKMKEMVEEQGEKGIESAMSYYSSKLPQKVAKNYASIKKISKKVKNFLIPN